MSDKTFYITTAISYPNGAPHIGHAYELIATDALARFKRLDGYDVKFLTGTDEHGQKMVKTARAEGIPVQELADRNTERFREMAKLLGASNDDFIRTSEPRHHAACQALWRAMEANGDIYKDTYSGWYSVRDEAYYGEDETELQEDGTRIGPQGTEVEWIEEESYFFRLSAWQERLLAHYEANPDFIGPSSTRKEIASFVSRGLRDLSISRTTFDWGVPVPDAPGHVMYVWVDALTNYISSLGYPNENEDYSKFWPADLHIIGKDITRFHTVYWPAFLMSAGLEVPKRVFGHGMLLADGTKMSKSQGNVVDPFELVGRYGLDAVRYFMLREVPFGQDGSYSDTTIINRVNADLANDLGNLAQRSLSMAFKNCDGQLNAPQTFTAEDEAILALAKSALQKMRAAMDQQKIHEALTELWDVVAQANRYFAASEPWALKKTDPHRMAAVLYVTAEVVRQVAIMAQPAIPNGAGALLDILNIPAEARAFDALTTPLANTKIEKPEGVFPRLEMPA